MSTEQRLDDAVREVRHSGLHLSKQRGQCLLRSAEVMEQILAGAEVGPADLVIDIGTGPGTTTPLVAPRCGHYIGVEIDAACFAQLRAKTAGLANCTLIHADILNGKRSLNPVVVAGIMGHAAAWPGPVKMVANLPYHVATPVIMRFLLQNRIRLERMVVMIQREMARKLIARPGSELYGAVAALAAATGEVSILFDVSRQAFFPVPQVDSTVVLIRPHGSDRRGVAEADLAGFEAFVKDLFKYRRKKAVNSIMNARVSPLAKDAVLAAMEAAGVRPGIGINDCTVADLVNLHRALVRPEGTA
ncbi:MAG: rRNA adenine dimethyltransferase family protein [Planctomycetota bacterium]